MKKYVKPALIYERFELSQNIADCAWEMNNNNIESCTASPDEEVFGEGMGGVTLFTSALACTYKSDGGYEDYCYQTGSGSPFKTFKS